MKKMLIFIFLLLLFSTAFGTENQPQLIKRTVLILPFINKNKAEKYDYLKDTLLNALESELVHTGQFNFTNRIKLEDILEKESGMDYFEKTKSAMDIAVKLKADVIVMGQFIIIEDKIMIQIKAIDIFSEQIAASSNINGELGVDLFRIIEETSKNIANKLAEELEKVDKSYFTEMLKIVNQKKRIELRKSLTPANRAGIILTATGSSLFIIGLPIFIYDVTGYGSILRDKKNQYSNGLIDYNEYDIYYQSFLGMFISGIIISSIGFTALTIGIPLIVYKNKNRKVSLSLNYSNYMNKMNLFFKIQI